MAYCSAPHLSLLLLLSLSLLSLSATAVPEPELAAALSAMRNNGNYSLFANAVATSDLYTTLLENCHVITLFPPPDPSVFSLDMSSDSPSDYLSSLRLHAVPSLRLSLSSLLLSLTPFPSLLPRHLLHVTSTSPLSINTVHVAAPGLFYSRSIAVHGLGGIILPRHQQVLAPAPADVAAPVGHVIMARGNLFTEETVLTCPLS